MPDTIQIVLSAGDIGSAVAHRMKRAGYRPVLVEGPAPGATRRLMSFAGAVHAGSAELEGLRAVRCDAAARALALAATAGTIPLLVADADGPLDLMPAGPVSAWIDARMRKQREPPVQLARAPLVIGIGPGFQAGVHCHAVIESNWGERLGQVLTEGRSDPYTGRHRVVAGWGRERYLYAPHQGTFHTDRELLTPVRVGDVLGRVELTLLVAQIDGILRGLAYDGLQVDARVKLVEVDPTGDPAACQGIGPRPARIAEGVLDALRRLG